MKFRIAFCGTSEIAVPFLDYFLDDPRFEVVFIMTKYDDPRKKGRYTVYRHLIGSNLTIYTPNKMKEVDDKLFEGLDASIVISYGHKIPNRMLAKTSWINMHGSLLPDLRGASPIQHAILYGYEMTGMTSTIMVEDIDAGPIIDQLQLAIEYNDTFATLAKKMSTIGPAWFADSVHSYLSGTIKAIPQDNSLATFAPIITDSYRMLDWNKTATQLYNQIRALNPDPCCIVKVDGVQLKVLESKVVENLDNKKHLIFPCKESYLRLTRIIPMSGKPMSDEEWLRGKQQI